MNIRSGIRKLFKTGKVFIGFAETSLRRNVAVVLRCLLKRYLWNTRLKHALHFKLNKLTSGSD